MKQLLAKLIESRPTEDIGEAGVAQAFSDFFTSNCPDSIIETDSWGESRANFSATLRGKSPGRRIVFVGHLDVVPAKAASWSKEPFALTEENGLLFGRGTTDMLGPLAAAAQAIAEFQREGDFTGEIVFAATAGEETDSCGVHRFAERFNVCADNPIAGIIVPEPTDMRLITAHKGLLWLEFITRGKTAHGSMPEHGENAILKMMDIAKKLTPEIFGPSAVHPALGRSTISLNCIQGGSAMNVVPDYCSATADIRLLPGQNAEQIEDIISLILEGAEYETVRRRYVQAFETPAGDSFIESLCAITGRQAEAVFFTTDAPYLKPLSESIAIIGPGKPEMCHRPDEHIEVSALESAKEIYKKILREFCGRS